jgi:RimJ/RimL family protein N-acetyltransferase
MTASSLASAWPPARIRVTTPRLELRLPTEGELLQLADVATGRIHDPATMPFVRPWTDAQPRDLVGSLLQWHWKCRADWSPEAWSLLLVAFMDGRPIGAQDARAVDYAATRSIASGSWISQSMQGMGLGTEMRQALLHLAFAGFDAIEATSGAYVDNPASIRVSAKCGYETVGERDVVRRRGELAPGGVSSETVSELQFRIDRDAWLVRRRNDIEVAGIDADVRRMVGMSVGD